MTKNLYKVVATRGEFVAHQCFQVADSEETAIEQVKSYHIPSGTKFDEIRAEFVREDRA